MSKLPAVSQNIRNLQARYAQAAAKEPETSFLPLLRFTKEGLWTFGRDRDELSIGTKIAIRADSLKEGFLCWIDSKVRDEIMRPVSGEPLANIEKPNYENEYTNQKDGWAEQYSAEGKFLDNGRDFVFKSLTVGGKQCFVGLLQEIAAQVGEFPEFPNPVVQLERDSYQHSDWGKIWKPEFVIADWMAYDSDKLQSKYKRLDGPNSQGHEVVGHTVEILPEDDDLDPESLL